MLTLFRWLDHTWISTSIRASTWGFAVIEMIHLLGLALLGGAILVLALRTLGVLLPRQPLARIAGALAPLLLGGLTVMVCSGALLVADGPLRYYANSAFRVKMLLLAVAVACGIPLYLAARRTSGTERPPRWLRAAAALSLILWLAVALAGRAIGVL